MDKLINNLSAIVGHENVLFDPDELLVYECDGLPHHKHRPRAVVFPASTEQTAAVMKELSRAQVPFTPRGAGTGLSGGALALNEGVVIEFARLRKILKLDPVNRYAVVEPGVINLQVSKAAAPFGLYYVPDPSSQPTCTIGGNIAESAGGIHCLKYGTTTDHVLGCRVVLANGDVVDLGGAGNETPGLDLLGTFVGSEGTFGIVTEATLKLVPIPPAVRTLLAEFREVDDASHAVSAIIAAGVMPAALEMMDHEIIRAVEASVFAAGLPPDAGAALLIELDGIEAGLDDEANRVISICMEFGARDCRQARDEEERKKLWAARKGAFGAIGRISPDSMIQDAVVPRSRLPQVLSAAYDIAKRYELRIANVFHAGDGNLHPLICFDSRFPDQVKRVKEAGRELMEVCVSAGGTITGEHGVGFDKRELLPLVFSESDMAAMLSVRAAFDPSGLLNPSKIVPILRGCGEGRAAVSTHGESRDIPENQVISHESHKTGADRHIQNSFNSDQAALKVNQIIGDDYVRHAGEASLIVVPGSIDEVIEVMKCAASEGWIVTPVGAMTWLSKSSHANLMLSTVRLNKIIEHEPADLIAIAEAGVTLRAFNQELARNGQWLPLDPPDNGRATLGGVVATGLGGAQQHGYGRPRGSVIGMKVVLSDGSLVKAGGRVVKNVAGYDLCKLFTGSYGALGIITELNFKLRPRPVRETTVVIKGPASELIEYGQRIISDRLFPVAIELLSSTFADRLGLKNHGGWPMLLVRFAGNDKAVEFQTRRTLSEQSADCTEVISDDTQLWQSLAAVPLETGALLTLRANSFPAKCSEMLEMVRTVFGDSFDRALWQLGVADGRLRMILDTGRATELIEELRAALRAICVSLVIEGTEQRAQDNDRISMPLKALRNRVKQQLDPQNLLPPLQAQTTSI